MTTGKEKIRSIKIGLSSNERPLVYHFQTTNKEKSKLFFIFINSLRDNRRLKQAVRH